MAEETQLSFILLQVPLVLLAMLGCTMNSISLSYFIQCQNMGIGNRVILTLVLLDLIICVLYPIQWYLKVHQLDVGHVTKILNGITTAFFLETNFLAVLLSVLRTTSVVLPFYRIRKRRVYTSIAIIWVIFLGLALWESLGATAKTTLLIYTIIFIPMTFTVMVSGTLTFSYVRKENFISAVNGGNPLQQEQRNQQLRKKYWASKTALYLTWAFVVTSSILWIGYAIWYFNRDTNAFPTKHPVAVFFILNSVINPIILIVRKPAIGAFIRNKIQKCTSP